MSLDLQVPISRPVHVPRLIRATATALAELLRVPEVPLITIRAIKRGNYVPVPETLDENGPMLLVDLGGYVLNVEFMIFRHDFLEQNDWVAGMTARATRDDPLREVLAAALAVAVAREMNTPIIDDCADWSFVEEMPAEEFMAVVRVTEMFTDIESAAAAMVRALPKGSQ